jgi:hypothetical protein
MSILPPELDNRIMDFLHSDQDALRACSLVCKDWLFASRLYLPGILRIDRANLQDFISLLKHLLSTSHQEKSNLLDSLNELDFHLIHLNFWTLLDSRTFKTTKTTKMQLRCN